jgi:hypothetical protein
VRDLLPSNGLWLKIDGNQPHPVLPGKILKITQLSDIWPLIAKFQAFVIWKI